MQLQESDATSERNPIKRFIFVSLGLFCVVLAGFGVLLPGIPTVGPLLLASLFFTKSSPALERRLIRNRFFAKYLPYLDGTEEMSRRARLATIATMWGSILVSCALLYFTGAGPYWLLATIAAAGLVGTIFIWRFGRKNRTLPPSHATD